MADTNELPDLDLLADIYSRLSVGVGTVGDQMTAARALSAYENRLREVLSEQQAAPPADAALIGKLRHQLAQVTEECAAIRARQPVKDSFNLRQLKDQASAWEAVYEELLKINPRLSELAPSGKDCAIAEIKRLAALRARPQAVAVESIMGKVVEFGVLRHVTGCWYTAGNKGVPASEVTASEFLSEIRAMLAASQSATGGAT